MTRVRRISVIVPMLNEADHVRGLVRDLAAQDYAGNVEVIVADGGSTDGSVTVLKDAAEAAGLAVEVIENGERWVSNGLNACIARASGDLIVRLDCHSGYPADYLSRCAAAAEETDALAVGGIVVPRGRTPTERAAACAMDSPFGGIGWMRGTSRAVRRDSDILTYGAFRRQTFDLVGGFDEALRRNQDDDFTFRIRRHGGRVLLDSTIHVYYTPRGSYRGIFRQYFEYGFWKVAVMRKHRRMLSIRSVAPPAFVASLVVGGMTATYVTVARWAVAAEIALYVGAAIAFAALSIRRRSERWSLLPRVAATFPAFHVGYGAGVVYGFGRTIAEALAGRPQEGASSLSPADESARS